MSYEGYEQHICASGHRFHHADSWNEDAVCNIRLISHDGVEKRCGAPTAFVNCVDDTNCDSHGLILERDWLKLKIAEPTMIKVKCECRKGKVKREGEPARYRIPSDDEVRKMRTMRAFNDLTGKIERIYIHDNSVIELDTEVLHG